jgi:hypothetical protein
MQPVFIKEHDPETHDPVLTLDINDPAIKVKWKGLTPIGVRTHFYLAVCTEQLFDLKC